jgi:uncharacterized membrane protein SpoIIM required for sporulation
MKKMILISLTMIFILSACSANLTLNGEGGINTNLLPEGNAESQQTEPQQTTAESLLSNPVVIILLIILGMVLIALVASRSRRPR